jgi:plastocyanin
MATENPPSSGDWPPFEERGTQPSPSSVDAGKDRAWRDWLTAAVGLTGLLSVMSVIIALSAQAATNPTSTTMMGQLTPTASATPAGKPETVKLIVKSGGEHAKLGSDGKYHDAFLPGNLAVHAGDAVTVTVYNYDPMPHSFTSSSLSSTQLINEMIPAGSAGAPTKTTFTFTAPSNPGKYAWWCAIPCDPFSMTHVGFMRGYVTVAA